MRSEGRHAQAVRELTVIVVHWPLAGYVSTTLFQTRIAAIVVPVY